ncbi:hypothetical protein WHX56_15750 [Achromobacter veterisilvae]|uniref:Uncharacterized protein n=1 Tax=Achromobacter veterisilvae TaxID=2069367 RepID=A0ABZ2RTM3_9BURK
MANAHTYFQSRLPPGELARILLRHERFFLENVGDMGETVAAIQQHCRAHGLTSQVRKQPCSPGLSGWDLLFLLPNWIGTLAAALLSASALAGPRADLIITLRSNSLLEVCYRRSTARA